jgi:hypothetical protein
MEKQELIVHLRNEAHAVKDCFTRFSFQALAVSTAVLGLILNFQEKSSTVAISSLSVVILVMIVAKIGNHKYNTANRNLGFILYLERMDSIKKDRSYAELFDNDIPWEEAMRAWRIVQSTVFCNVYSVGRILPNRRILNCGDGTCSKYKTCNNKKDVFWFEPASIAETSHANYYAGSYLESVQTILFFMAYGAVLPLIFTFCRLYGIGEFYYCGFYVVISLGTLLIISWRIIRIRARRKILEGGLLSIHSCGILWEAVILAHKIALKETIDENQKKSNDKINHAYHLYESYTKNLSSIAVSLLDDVCDIHSWIEANRKRLRHIGPAAPGA